MVFDAFRINHFGDLIDMKVGINALSLFEVIDGKVQNKLALEGITEIVRESDNCCRVKIEWGSHDLATYIFRPEDYDSFIANLFHFLEDVLSSRIGGTHGLTVMEERVCSYSMFSYRNIESHIPIRGLVPSAKIDEVLLTNIQPSAETEVSSG